MFLQVCKGLNALHTEAGKAHLDIKLENILVHEDGYLKLCDFGMVQPVDADICKRHGTEMYMAPEIEGKAFDETYRGVPADIFSLGVLLWIMHFGTPPFAKATKNDRNYSILVRNAEAFWRLHPSVRAFDGSVDEDLKTLLTGMLSSDALKRPESVASLVMHPFFTKESNLVDSVTNEWTDSESLFA